LDDIIGLIGPIIHSYIRPEHKLDLNLIYMLLVAKQLSEQTNVDPIDFAVVSREFLNYFDSVLDLTIPKNDQQLIEEWGELKQRPDAYQWRSILDYVSKVILKYRDAAKEGRVTVAHVTGLKHYIYCSSLLLECLQVAIVSDRKAIENSVYRLPHGFSSIRVQV
jgi:hypothetical protein